MQSLGTPFNPRRMTRLALVAVAISVSAVGLVASLYWLQDHLPAVTVWKARLTFLLALELAYAVVLASSLLSLPILVLWLRGSRTRPRGAARGLLLAGSLVLALLGAEACSAIWWQRTHRFSALPVGGLRIDRLGEGKRALPAPPEQVVLPSSFPERSPGEPRDVLVLGESSAEGVPYNYWMSIGHIVAWQLERTIPGLKVRLNIFAGSGETLERQHERLSALTRRPDLVIVYCGHNEFSARFHASREVEHYPDSKIPSWGTLIVGWIESVSPICRVIRESAEKCRVAIPPPPAGDRVLVDVPAFLPSEYDILLSDFERRLEAIVAFTERIGATTILIAPPGNDSGYEPNRSYLPPETTWSERIAFEREFLEIRRREEQEPARCLTEYRALLERHPGFAELHYRIARLLEQTGAWDEVYRHDCAARDLDGLPDRCPTRFQAIYRSVAARHHCILIDGQSYFHKIGFHGLLEDHLFHDGMHPSLRGQIALAQGVLQGIREQGTFGWPATTPVRPIDPADCAEHFGLVPEAWRQVSLWGIMFYDKTAPARFDPANRNRRSAEFARGAERIKAGEAPEHVGLVNIGIPEPVPLVPDAATIPAPATLGTSQ
jgi:lysophospholipase L1-like esterase